MMETSQQPEGLKEIVDAFDAVGNNTEATAKCIAFCSIELVSFLLVSAYISSLTHQTFNQVDIAIQ